jgi:hypothetical protein
MFFMSSRTRTTVLLHLLGATVWKPASLPESLRTAHKSSIPLRKRSTVWRIEVQAVQSTQHEPSSHFSLKPGERITACFPLAKSGSDRIIEELGNCHHCLHPTYRIIALTSASGLERRAALCVAHYVAAARAFPELKRQSA